MAWYNASWTYRVKVTVLASKVDADLTDYPVYVDLSNLPAGFHTNVNQTDARDIRVTTSDGVTEVPREVVFYDSATDTGELHFKGNILNASNVDFYIYYGNAGATEPAVNATYGRNNVWTNGFKGVYHLGETCSGSAGEVIDSTGVNNGVGQGSSGYPTTLVSGKVGKASSFLQANKHRISVTDDSSLDLTSEIALEAWVNADTLTNNGILMKGPLSSDQGCYSLIVATAGTGWYGRLNGSQVEGTGQESGGTPTSAWHYLVLYRDGVNDFKLRLDGVEIGTESYSTAITPNNDPLYIGAYFSDSFTFDGDLDEIRVSNLGRTTAWYDASFNNQNSSSTFYNVGVQETNTANVLLLENGFILLQESGYTIILDEKEAVFVGFFISLV